MKAKKEKVSDPDSQASLIEIFEAGPFDLDALSILFDKYRQFYKQKSDLLSAKEFLSARLKNKDSVIFIAFDESFNAVGFTQLYPLFSSVGMKKTWLLNDLFVLEAYRGQGISRKLIARAKELSVDSFANGLHLETEKSNLPGNKLYPSEGFELNTASNFYFWKRS